MSNFLSVAVVDRERSANISFAARLWRELSFFLNEPHWHCSTQQMHNLCVPLSGH